MPYLGRFGRSDNGLVEVFQLLVRLLVLVVARVSLLEIPHYSVEDDEGDQDDQYRCPGGGEQLGKA